MDKFRIVQVSDIHVGPTVGKAEMDYIVEAVNNLQPDLIVITGDLVDGSVERYESSVQSIKNLKSKYGNYFVTGNHEYINGYASEWTDHLQSLGVKCLRNSHVTIAESFDLAGVEDWTAYQ